MKKVYRYPGIPEASLTGQERNSVICARECKIDDNSKGLTSERSSYKKKKKKDVTWSDSSSDLLSKKV